MSTNFSAVLLQAGGGAQTSPISMLLPMALIFLIFYFLLIRPQQRRQRDHDAMLKALEKGDRVVTSGGLHGVITGISDDVLTLEIANLRGERVRVKVDRPRIERLVEKGKGGENS
jgi:preprotein translocase subunit YajC